MPKFFDFCAGIGAGHFAFAAIGGQCVGYSEITPKSEQTYRLLFGDKLQNYGDLTKIIPGQLPDFDILLAGFPCQSFSIVGKRKGLEDDRGKIIYSLAKIIEHKKPKAFLLENVKGLINLDKGSAFKEILDLLSKQNYRIYYRVLDSLDYGVLQMRERIYIVGIRDDLAKPEFNFPLPLKDNLNITDFLCDDNEDLILQGSAYQTFLGYLENKYNKGRFVLQDLLAKDYLVLDGRQSDLRLYENKVPTIRTGRQGILYVKNQKLRKLSAIEALLLQGFDLQIAKNIADKVSSSNLLSQAGNAMTINVMQAIGKNILEHIK